MSKLAASGSNMGKLRVDHRSGPRPVTLLKSDVRWQFEPLKAADLSVTGAGHPLAQIGLCLNLHRRRRGSRVRDHQRRHLRHSATRHSREGAENPRHRRLRSLRGPFGFEHGRLLVRHPDRATRYSNSAR
jgi:hypothetical protein